MSRMWINQKQRRVALGQATQGPFVPAASLFSPTPTLMRSLRRRSAPPTAGLSGVLDNLMEDPATSVPYWRTSYWITSVQLMVLGAGTMAYHGYQRNRSAGWALLWGLFGLGLPLPTAAVAVVQGYGRRKKR